MKEGTKQSKMDRYLITAASFVIVVAGMKAAGSILVPFILSALIAVICSSPLFWLRGKSVPAGFAVLIVLIGIMVVALVIAALAGTSLKDFSLALPFYQEHLRKDTAELLVWLGSKGIDISDQGLLKYFDPGKVMQLVASVFTGLGGVFTNTFLIVLTVIFILLEASSFPTKLRAAFGDEKSSFSDFSKIISGIKRYVAIKTLTSLTIGILIAICLAVIGVDYPILWGLLAFLLNYVPNIGSIIAAVPAVFLAFIQLGMVHALFATLGYLVVNGVIGSVIEPRVMGRGVGLSTLVVFLSLVFWGWVLGPVGMLLSVPLTIILKIVLESNEDTRWIAILLGSKASAEAVSPDTNKATTTATS